MSQKETKQTFWDNLEKPFSVLAPMEDVTDTVFRRLVANCGRPDVFFTEFTSTDGLFSPGREAVIHRLQFTEEERPLVAQIWGNNPENYYKAAKLLVDMNFDGIDINMGCPVPKIVKNGCCSALIDNHPLAKELILAAKEGAGDIPVSVKTRLGFKKKKTEEWVNFLLDLQPAAICLHGRTAKQMSKVPADWEEIGKAVILRNQKKLRTPIIGNGDITSMLQAQDMHTKYGVDGVMIGRGVFNDLYVFNKSISRPIFAELDTNLKLKMLLEHAEAYCSRWQGSRSFNAMKKFFKIYISNFKDAGTLRGKLVEEANSLDDLKMIISDFLESNSFGQFEHSILSNNQIR
ncbi:MAG: tRNA-dihydrouridine synthase [Bdellovibrionales bacterium]|nr:tRNA-dihydrouridine synthase [Bdellovibrionales bacterium]